jgi:excisionase family DNA binding protein
MEVTTNEVLKVPEVAENLRVPRSRAYELIQRGEIPSFKIGERSVRGRSIRCSQKSTEATGRGRTRRGLGSRLSLA